ncbi:type VI secretion system-associated FHA domain protein TagH [Sphingomonas sp. S2-65]|uniref:type VI secretion system-associated FHA domain protein TagH n=1 Tax=Sphingomonas sp. S2-65 TaxID=2903960 RepID=UPI001F2A0D4A|nr:type VI secretion system-associated FHA domain protein TagH [Sphingomonas sp. S2-65]UYY57210.1 type VI secretion system-associated FHA domain protein TagH [Sphingomonas sp. S2-65]
MTLRLRIANVGRPTLDNGVPAELVLQDRGALIGRSPNCDWSLPDPRNHISSRHCEIRFQNGDYYLTDLSMNGTFVNGRPERLTQPHRLVDGDLLTIGTYEVRVTLSASAVGASTQAPVAASQWDGWNTPEPSALEGGSGLGASPASTPSSAGGRWDAPPSSPGWGTPPVPTNAGGNDAWGPSGASRSEAPASQGWAPAPTASEAPVTSAWNTPAPASQAPSGWSSAAPDRPPPPSPDDIWGRLAEGNVVDWARGGFGQPIQENPDPLGIRPVGTEQALGVAPARLFGDANVPAPTPIGAPVADQHFAMPPVVSATPAPASAPLAAPAPAPVSDLALIDAFLRAAGVEDSVAQRSPALLDRAGQLFHRLVAGLVVMVEARARAKSQMGAESTAFQIDGNNPIKFARTPEEAIAALLNPPARGFMEAGQAIESAYFDLQSHQIATLRAMQGALRATLERFSPGAIRQRAESKGLLARILPRARDAALWQAYEREFGGVAQGSDEAFMDVFAKEFRRAYEEQSHPQPPRR